MELYLDDCFNILEDTPDKSIDFIYCDLPYNETSCKFDKDVIDLAKLWDHYKRIAKNDETPFMFSCSVKFGNKLINSNPKWFRYEFLWIKSNSTGFLNAKKMPMRKSEMVYVFYKKLPSVYGENLNLHHTHKFLKETKNNIIVEGENIIVEGQTLGDKNNECYGDFSYYNNGVMGYEPKLPTNVQEEQKTFKRGKNKKTNEDAYNYDERVNNGKLYHHDRSLQKGSDPLYNPPLPTNVLEIKSEKKLHPTQKPVALIEFLLKYYSRENDLCLDVCMGSGTTGVACLNMNRRFIGIEKDEKFFAIAMDRIEKHPNYKSTTSS